MAVIPPVVFSAQPNARGKRGAITEATTTSTTSTTKARTRKLNMVFYPFESEIGKV
jgi:hypothetical protein